VSGPWDPNRRVPGDGLAFARAALGVLLFIETARYVVHGWVSRYYVEPTFLFPYPGFEWVPRLPRGGLYAVIVALAGAALVLVTGRFARVAAATLLVGFAYLFLLDQTNYLNHLYLILLVTLHFALAPPGDGETRAGVLFGFRFLVAIPYVFGAVAKIEPDWLSGLPLQIWLGDHAWLGPRLDATSRAALAQALAWLGFAFDLLIVPGLVWRRTRAAAFALAVLFHLTNAFLFRIGIFPPVMIALSTLFFDPAWPRRFRVWTGLRAFVVPRASRPPRAIGRRAAAAWCLAIAVPQVLLPWRHLLYPGRVVWTEEGHLFSWHMKLRDKRGSVRFFLRDPVSGRKDPIAHHHLLTARQEQQMVGRPQMLARFARHLRDEAYARTLRRFEVTAQAWVSLNGRAPRLLVHPEVDLASVEPTWRAAWWIVR
jgi:hypothetical protein